MITPIREDVEELHEMFIATPEGRRVADILVKLDNYLQPWVHKDIVQKLKKEILVQFLDPDYKIEDDSVHYVTLE
jgi:hypothetical protein